MAYYHSISRSISSSMQQHRVCCYVSVSANVGIGPGERPRGRSIYVCAS